MSTIKLKNLSDVGSVVNKLIGKELKNIVSDILYGLIDTTPVWSGYARASWVASPNALTTKSKIGEPPTEWEPGNPIILYDINVAYNAVDRLDSYIKTYHSWFINNTAPYIEQLNSGSSKQAPSGFVALSVNKVIRKYS